MGRFLAAAKSTTTQVAKFLLEELLRSQSVLQQILAVGQSQCPAARV
jgi:hypothetical protein